MYYKVGNTGLKGKYIILQIIHKVLLRNCASVY